MVVMITRPSMATDGWSHKASFLVLLALFAVVSGSAFGQKPINESCPVTPDEVLGDDAIVFEYLGRNIGVCCKRCRSKFLANPKKYEAALPPQISTGETEKPGHHDEKKVGEKEEHDHGNHKDSPGIIKSLGRFHPVIIHFPIAFLILAAFIEAWAVFKKTDPYGVAVRPLMFVGAISSVIAVALGFAVAYQNEQGGDLLIVFERHRFAGVMTSVLGVLSVVFAEWWRRGGDKVLVRFFRSTLVLSALSVGLTGHLGGTLIYGLNYFS